MKRIKIALFSLLVVFGLLGFSEAMLRVLGVGAPADDPYLDIAGDISVYERVGDWYETRNDKRRLFRNERFEVHKRQGTKRIFCLGGSSVNGFPYAPEGAWPAMLEEGLNSQFPLKWRVINSGGIAYASYRILRVFKEVMQYEPDAIVVMTGHNEFLEKRVYAEPLAVNPRLRAVRAVFGKTYLFNLLRSFLEKGPKGEKAVLGENVSWDFVPRDATQKKITQQHYEFALREMALNAHQEGVPLILMTLPCNLKDYPPLGGEEDDAAHRAYNSGLELLKAGKKNEAYAAFRQAADLDEHPVRAYSAYNEIVRKVASSPGVFLADSELVFLESSGGIPGDGLFFDHVHFRSEGAALVANEVAETLANAGLIPAGMVGSVKTAIEKARKAIPPREEAIARYGAAYEAFRYLRLYERATALLKEAIKIDPSFMEARRLLDEIPKESTFNSEE